MNTAAEYLSEIKGTDPRDSLSADKGKVYYEADLIPLIDKVINDSNKLTIQLLSKLCAAKNLKP